MKQLFIKPVYTAYIYDIRSEQWHMHQLQIMVNR